MKIILRRQKMSLVTSEVMESLLVKLKKEV